MKYFALLALMIAVACGGKKNADFVDNSGGASGSVAGSTGHAGRNGSAGSSAGGEGGEAGEAALGGDAGAGADSDLGPIVDITAPASVTDPAAGKVLTADEVVVNCSVTPSKKSGIAVLGSSTSIRMFGADGKQIGADGSVMSTNKANEYSARFVLTSVPSGPVSFVCKASDAAVVAHSTTATVQTFYDAGPVITLINPANKSAHPLGAILFKFSALPVPLTDGDKGASVTSVTLKVNGVAISDVVPAEGTPNTYEAEVDLNDTKTFLPKPVGSVPVVIVANNKRGTAATQAFAFIVDSIGPTIKIVSPPTTSVQFVGNLTTLKFTVTDEDGGSGIDPSTVNLIVNQSPPSYYLEGDSWHLESDLKTFDYTFHIQGSAFALGLNVTIEAFDDAGNRSEGTSAFYYVDTVSPIVDLQPAIIQEEKESGDTCNISEFFDPLGDSPKDLATIPSVNKFRALLWDLGNVVDSKSGISFFSDIDTEVGARLYFQQDVSQPLLRNAQGTAGGTCNQIADTTLPFIPLTPIAPAGAAYYDKDAPLSTNSSCVDGTDSTAPKRLCNQNSALARVIQHETATSGTNVAVIYGFQPDAGALCTGGQFDLTTTVAKDGWICAAVVAQDKLGNRAVSAPLRLCLDAPPSAGPSYADHPACVTGENPPTCVAVGGCVPPPHFNPGLIAKP